MILCVGREGLAGGFALIAAGDVLIGTVCSWLKASARQYCYAEMLVGFVLAAALTLPFLLPRQVYQQRWHFVVFSVFCGGFYTMLLGWMRLDRARRS
jgi:hypothetical protein